MRSEKSVERLAAGVAGRSGRTAGRWLSNSRRVSRRRCRRWTVSAWLVGTGRRAALAAVEAAEDVDEGVFEVALLAVELDDLQAVLDHAARARRRPCRARGVDADAAAVLAGFEELDVRVEHAPVGDRLRVADRPARRRARRRRRRSRASGISASPWWTMRPLLMKSSESHISPSSERMWEEMKIVLPSSARTRMRCLSSTRAFGSRPAAGSSMMRTCGSWSSARPRQRRWVMPLESLLEKRSASGTRSVNSMTSCDARAAFLAAVAEGAGVEVEVFEHGHVLVVAEVVGHPADAGGAPPPGGGPR